MRFRLGGVPLHQACLFVSLRRPEAGRSHQRHSGAARRAEKSQSKERRPSKPHAPEGSQGRQSWRGPSEVRPRVRIGPQAVRATGVCLERRGWGEGEGNLPYSPEQSFLFPGQLCATGSARACACVKCACVHTRTSASIRSPLITLKE